MSNMDVSIHWFIARDGRQHGPVSDMEMRKLLELGHLRHTDLLWRQGFPDWRPAPAVFAGSPAPSPMHAPLPGMNGGSPALERARPQQSASPSLMPRFEATAGRGANSGAGATAAAAAAANGASISAQWAPPGRSGPGPQLNSPQLNGPQLNGLQSGSSQPGGYQPGAGPDRGALQAGTRSGPQFIPGGAGREPRLDNGPTTTFHDSSAQPANEQLPRPKARRVLVATVVVLGLLAGGGTYYARKHGTTLTGLFASKAGKPEATGVATADAVGSAKEASAPAAPDSKSVATATATPVALAPPPPEKVQAVESQLQKMPYWAVIATEFPDWYRQKVDAAARLAADGKSDAEVSKTLVQAVVELRRNQSESALAASSASLKILAAAFKATVTRMGKEGTPTCMGFIMAGESNDSVLSMIADPNKNAEINAHLLAIFNAVAEGRKAATLHADPADGDYKLLVAELVKGGWTQAELELFADPKGASRTTPERYCQMMQDFFAAHLTIPDAAVQDRLLHRTLKLVVSG